MFHITPGASIYKYCMWIAKRVIDSHARSRIMFIPSVCRQVMDYLTLFGEYV